MLRIKAKKQKVGICACTVREFEEHANQFCEAKQTGTISNNWKELETLENDDYIKSLFKGLLSAMSVFFFWPYLVGDASSNNR